MCIPFPFSPKHFKHPQIPLLPPLLPAGHDHHHHHHTATHIDSSVNERSFACELPSVRRSLQPLARVLSQPHPRSRGPSVRHSVQPCAMVIRCSVCSLRARHDGSCRNESCAASRPNRNGTHWEARRLHTTLGSLRTHKAASGAPYTLEDLSIFMCLSQHKEVSLNVIEPLRLPDDPPEVTVLDDLEFSEIAPVKLQPRARIRQKSSHHPAIRHDMAAVLPELLRWSLVPAARRLCL